MSRGCREQIFKVFQKEGCQYVKTFRGCGFYIYERDDIMMVKGRNTFMGPTEYKLVPPHSILYRRLAETFHRKYHTFGSPVYIRAQLLESGYCLPQIVKRLISLQDSCPLCRKNIKKALHTAMGTVQKERLTVSAPFLHL